VPPDDIPPAVASTPDAPAAWDRYGLRVPAFVVSPYAKRRFVSHKVHDHTSVLRFIETKFNLGALTRRDAQATNLLDCFDFRSPAFLEPPVLDAPGLPATGSVCTPSIPPPPTEPSSSSLSSSSGSSSAVPVRDAIAGSPPLSESQSDRLALLAHIRAG